MNKNTYKHQSLQSSISKIHKNNGFSLFEMIVVLIVSGVILSATVNMYTHYLDVHNRQERVMLVQRTLTETANALAQTVSVLPGQGLGSSNGEIFSIPILPNAGSIDQNGKLSTIQLGIFTPYKINGEDAFTMAYADPTFPRFSIKETTKIDPSNIKVKIASPLYLPGKLPPPPPPNYNNQTAANNNIKAGSNSETNIIIPPHTPTPTPTPSPVITPPPNPVPPNVPFNSTLLGQNWIPATSMFNVGDVFLLVTSPSYDATDQSTTQTRSALVQITSVSSYTPTLAQGGSAYIELGLSVCSQGCGTFQGLTNPPIKVLAGTNLVPLRLSSFYVKQSAIGKKLIRNDNGVILPVGNGLFQVQGGKETFVGQTDSLTVSYYLDDGTVQSTPNTPVVPWLNKIISVDITISSTMPAPKGTEQINQQLIMNFPLNVRQLQ